MGNTPDNPNPEPKQKPNPPAPAPKPAPPKIAPLFAALNCDNIDKSNPNYRGLIAICSEIIKFSRIQANPRNYPIAAVMLTRSLLEHTLIAFLKSKGQWADVVKSYGGGKDSGVKLNHIVKHCVKRGTDLFKDHDVRTRFMSMFENYDAPNKLNWVIHQLNAYKMSTETLQALVDEGLFNIIQYMINNL